MTFAEKLKSARKQAGMSQEKLAESIGVSRQTVTKWETSLGLPDLENLKALSQLFAISLDEFLCNDKKCGRSEIGAYESTTEIDVDRPKSFDIKLGGAKSVELIGYDGEKLQVSLASPTLSGLQTDLKFKIDDNRNRLDLVLFLFHDITESDCKDHLYVQIRFPQKYLTAVEIAVHTDSLLFRNLEGRIEFDGKAGEVTLDGVIGRVELNCNLDMKIACRTLCGSVEVNQLSATSRLIVPKSSGFRTSHKGRKNRILYEAAGSAAAPFDDPTSDNLIELNGIKSELIICKE